VVKKIKLGNSKGEPNSPGRPNLKPKKIRFLKGQKIRKEK